MKENLDERLREIRRSFHLEMNGVTAQSMRDKGVDYHVNWGIPFMRLKQKAKEIGQDYDLAIALWKDDVRESKILATLLMPPAEIPMEVAEIWMEQVKTQEMAEMLAFNLLQHCDFGAQLAYRWMASDEDAYQICAYSTLSRLFMQGREPNERGIHEFIDQAVTALKGGSVGVKHAAMNAVMRFADLGVMYERVASSAMRKEGIELF